MIYNEELFWSLVEPEEYPCDCRLWLCEWTQRGYGIWISNRKPSRGMTIAYETAYRAAYKFSGRELPVGRTNYLGHICGLTPCCNPLHLRVISPGQNSQEAVMHRNVFRSFSDHSIQEIRASGMSFKEVSRSLNVPGVVAFKIVHGEVDRDNYPAPFTRLTDEGAKRFRALNGEETKPQRREESRDVKRVYRICM